MRCVIVADDLTGAADASAPLADQGLRVCIAPWSEASVPTLRGLLKGPWDVVVAETDSREVPAAIAGARVSAVAREIARARAAAPPPGPWIVKKIDSLLRGPVAAEVSALRTDLGTDDVVIAPALPSLGRTTEDGIQCWDGRPVDLPRVDGAGSRLAADADVARACGHPGAMLVPTGGGLPEGGVRVCDARTESDLERLAAAIAGGATRPLLVCSSGLLGALGPHIGRAVTSARARTRRDPGPTLVISLSPTAPARRQVAHLNAHPRTQTVVLPVAAAAADPAAAAEGLRNRLGTALDGSAESWTVVLTVEEHEPDPSGTHREAILATVRTALRLLTLPQAVVLNGGDTARVLLDAKGVGTLEVLAREAHGAAAVRTDSGMDLVMKSGSFGPDSALADLVQASIPGPVRAPAEG